MIKPESKIGIAGAGTMGTGIAQVVAAAGHTVSLYDSSSKALKHARVFLEKTLEKLVRKNKFSSREAAALLDRIEWVSSMGAFSTCDLVIEAVVENLAVKQQLLQDIEQQVNDRCIIATNTSSLSVTSVAGKCSYPGRVIGMHFFNPAPVMPLVEIVPGLATRKALAEESKELMKRWGKVPVIAKDTPGFIVNRIARPFYGEAIRIYEEGIADFAAIDQTMKESGGFKMGPFELMDLIGNDVNYQVTTSVWEQLYYDPRYKPSITQKRLFESGRLGRKSGRGYYNYESGTVPPLSDVGKKDETILMRILSMLINEAADALYFGLADKEDIELAMTKGVNYPKGLLHWADEIGIQRVYDLIDGLRNHYHEDRYRPSVLLKKMAEENSRFFT